MQVELVKNSLLKGWVSEEAAAVSTEVEVCINGTPVITADVCRPVEVGGVVKPLGFQRRIKGVWNFVTANDRVTVDHAGDTLDLRSLTVAPLPSEGARPLAELQGLLNNGHTFDKYGNLRKRIDSDREWQLSMMGLYAEVRELIRERFGLNLLVTYGTMLGAVREGNFISHDNDVDTIYISRHSSPAAVKAEFVQVCEFLIEKGYRIFAKATHTWVFAPGEDKDAKLDIFFSWFDENDLYHLSYGYFGEPVRREAFREVREASLGEHKVDVPIGAEDVLAQMYGANWRVPDKGFRHAGAGRRLNRAYLLSSEQVEALRGNDTIYWRKFYKHTPPPPPSSFARLVASKAGSKPLVVAELGCGNGRDSIYFASLGHRVVAGDRAQSGLKQGEAARDAAMLPDLSFVRVDAASPISLSRFVKLAKSAARTTERDVLLYMRFFLHSVPEPTEDNILHAVRALPPGSYVAMEFRTVQDADTPKAFGQHYRRFIDADELARKMSEKYGIDVLHLEQGRGLAVYKDEDPHVARIVARRRIGRRRKLRELFRARPFDEYAGSFLAKLGGIIGK